MAKHLLASAMALFVACSSVWAQTVEDRNGFSGRSTTIKEAVPAQRVAQLGGSQGLVSEIFPNPTSNQGSFQVNLGTPGKIVFFNLLGTAVASQEFSKEAKLVTVDFSDFAEGVYFGIVSSGNKTICTRRISIKR